jgi:hypothetical protein
MRKCNPSFEQMQAGKLQILQISTTKTPINDVFEIAEDPYNMDF